jgi:hypothetical protein
MTSFNDKLVTFKVMPSSLNFHQNGHIFFIYIYKWINQDAFELTSSSLTMVSVSNTKLMLRFERATIKTSHKAILSSLKAFYASSFYLKLLFFDVSVSDLLITLNFRMSFQ